MKLPDLGDIFSGNFFALGEEQIYLKEKNDIKAEYGDVICVRKGLQYKHFGIYAGNGRVIHYSPGKTDKIIGFGSTIHEADMGEFMGDADRYHVCVFAPEYGRPEEVNASEIDKLKTNFLGPLLAVPELIRKKTNEEKYHLYSPEETVARARSKIGEKSYNLFTHNCEHFALWCKTGIDESHQINHWKDILAVGVVAGLAIYGGKRQMEKML